jgi:hypothetical protein
VYFSCFQRCWTIVRNFVFSLSLLKKHIPKQKYYYLYSELHRMRAISFLWTVFIGGLGSYQVFFVDPKIQPYFGGQYSYWLIHDVKKKTDVY